MPIKWREKIYVRHNSFCNNVLFFSSDFEVVDGALIFVVKSYSSGPSEGPASADTVRIVHTPGAWASISSPPIDWTFTCSCPSYARSLVKVPVPGVPLGRVCGLSRRGSEDLTARSPPVCEHIAACLIVHFY